MSGVTEFIFFHLNPAIKPEDPTNNEAGASLLELFKNTKHQNGYLGSSWGRSIEDENVVVWVIDWKDAQTSPTLTPSLTPYLSPSTPLTTFYATLSPPPPAHKTHDLSASPVTEIFTPWFPTSMSADEKKKLHESLVAFRTELVENLEEGKRPRGLVMGQVERPGTRKHGDSPSGEAFGMVVLAGWESVEAHMEIKGTEAFGRGIGPIREWMLKGDGGDVEKGEGGFGIMRHVRFQKVE
ncbi:hypothetical protein AtubIFM55763_007537 [Aspergillus tubingensis]|uniref:Similar to An11g04640 n=1 Tax=Aspergillus niger TaxID=5061 RepID=A0A100IJB8_ASPNG|nr:similar to An11g04640 [Aspergillus niger]GLA65663.1 hypothetical protein AtubIFM54640_007852 [Aspergillus tubingensis]GLA75975.1 hypothetical protein AtubIFM55763_007537 [Aspergillus tubingensis]GLA92257.1 hypothetical protein AtubIFM57143_007772 [Aspergillus tubingensis]GLB17495.1 hypothetical protein AtubIFM61612_007369 [Aspergillus tubingensis]